MVSALGKRYLILGAIIVVLLLGIFLFNKFKKAPDYLKVVPNAMVTTVVKPKRYYRFIYSTTPAKASFTIPTTTALLDDYTGKNLPGLPSTAKGVAGDSKVLNVYNSDQFDVKITGLTLSAIPDSTSVKDKITQTIGPRTGYTPTKYTGDPVILNRDMQIQFSNLSNFVVTRLTIICNNKLPHELFVYFMDTGPQYIGARFDNLRDDILVIDFYKDNT